MNNLEAKKRILFDKDKDACFLTYNILIILDFYKCYSSNCVFNDYRKLTYLIDFVSSDILANIISKDTIITPKEKILLHNSYTNSSSRQNKLFLVIQSLRQKQIIDVSFDENNPLKSRLFLIDQDKIAPIIDKKIFKYEYNNLKNFNGSKIIRGIKSYKLLTLLQQIYETKGIKIWET